MNDTLIEKCSNHQFINVCINCNGDACSCNKCNNCFECESPHHPIKYWNKCIKITDNFCKNCICKHNDGYVCVKYIVKY